MMTDFVITNVAWRCAAALCGRVPTLDREEVAGEARVIALEALREWDGRGEAEGWVGWMTARRLTGKARSDRWRRACARPGATARPRAVPAPEPDRLARLLSEASEDARQAAKIALQAGGKIRTVKLLRKAGWHAASIRVVFKELREVLAGA